MKKWQYGKLEDAVKKGSSNISLSKVKNDNGEYPLFSAKGFAKNISFFQQDSEYLSIIKDGAGIGRVAKHPANSSIVATMQYLIPKPGYDIDFIKYFLYGLDTEKYRTGSTIPHIYFRDYRNEKFPLVDIDEQKEIVRILDEAFAAIDKAQANIERNIQNTDIIFQTKLSKIFNNGESTWTTSLLGEVCDLAQGLAINKKTKHLLVEKSSLPLLRIKDLRDNSEEQYVAEEGYPSNAKIEKDDIIYTRTGQIGLVFRGRYGVLHNNSFKVKPREMLTKEYLFWALQEQKFKRKITNLASRAAQPDITHKLFKAQEIKYPPLNIQEQITSQIQQLYHANQKILKNYHKQYQSLSELKKSILQKAFSGELTADMGK